MTKPAVEWLAAVSQNGAQQFSLYLLAILFAWKPRIVAASSVSTMLVFKGFVPQSWFYTLEQKAKELGDRLSSSTGLSVLVGTSAVLVAVVTYVTLQTGFILTVVASVLCTFCLLGGRMSIEKWSDIIEFREEQGALTGKLTITLIWKTKDDLDLWCETPSSGKISYSNKRAGGGYLDVDANAGNNIMYVNGSIKAIENIFFENTPASGLYHIKVHNYAHRTSQPIPFDVGLQINGQMKNLFSGCATTGGQELDVCTITIDDKFVAKVAMGTGVRKS